MYVILQYLHVKSSNKWYTSRTAKSSTPVKRYSTVVTQEISCYNHYKYQNGKTICNVLEVDLAMYLGLTEKMIMMPPERIIKIISMDCKTKKAIKVNNALFSYSQCSQ